MLGTPPPLVQRYRLLLIHDLGHVPAMTLLTCSNGSPAVKSNIMQANQTGTALPRPQQLVSIDTTGELHDSAKNKHWLVSPSFDLLFVCGVAPWILGLLSYGLLGNTLENPNPSSKEHALTIGYVVLSLLIGESHQFTSIVRYFFGPKPGPKVHWINRLPLRIIWFTLLTMLIASIASLMHWEMLLGFLSVVLSIPFMTIGLPLVTLASNFFPLILMHHICVQAKTIGMMYCRQNGYQLSKEDNTNLAALSIMLVFAGACNIALPFSVDDSFIKSDGFVLARTVWNWTTIAGLAYVGNNFVQRGIRTKQWLPAPAAILWINLLLFSLLPPSPMVYVWLFVPVFFHATQHWAVAWSTKKSECIDDELPTHKLLKEFLCKLVLPVQALTLSILFIPAIFKDAFLFGSQGGTLNVGWSMLVFYIHYFTDRIVWRPRLKEAKNEG